MRLKESFFTVAAFVIFGSHLEAEILINGGNLNGGFESGEILPWSVSSGDSLLAVEDGAEAYEGLWYAEVGIDAGRAFVEQTISTVTPTVSDTFLLSFRARNLPQGPTSVYATLRSYVPIGAPVNAKELHAVEPQLTDSEWREYSYTFQFDRLWDPTRDLYLEIAFRDGWAADSKGFLDAIVLEQIPEPSTVLIVLFGLVLILCFRQISFWDLV
jgi:hypothetical protein